MASVRPIPRMIALSLVLALVGLDVFTATPAEAANFTVNKTADTADGTCDADCSLREAIIAANAAAGADTITLPAGNYVLTIAGEDEDAAATGDLDITDDLAITGPNPATTIVDGDDSVSENESDRVFDVFGQGLTVTLAGMTIQGGEQTGSNNVQDDGGGIRVANAVEGSDNTLTIRNSVVRDNHAGAGDGDSASGGGIFLSGDNDTLNLDNTKVGTFGFPNTATRGAGIKANGTGNEINVLSGSEVSFNDAVSSGGGIFLLGAGHAVVVDNSTVNHNTAGFGTGGGIYIHSGNTDTTVDVRNGSEINENTAGSVGGGIRAIGANGFELDVTQSEILGNIASSGGGLYLSNPNSRAIISGSRIAFNRALGECGDGGGILNSSSAPPPGEGPSYSLEVVNGSSVDRNYALCEGGGVQLEGVGSLLLDGSSVDHNVAGDSGGGIYAPAFTFFSVEDGAVDLNISHENGGGIYNDGTGNIDGESEVVGNSAPRGNGGGIYNGGDVNEAVLTVGSSEAEGNDPVIAGNTGNSGGGIYNTSGSTATIAGSFIAGNSAVADDGTGSGGGIENSGDLSMTATVVAFNTAGSDGGGIANHSGGAPGNLLSSSLVLGNSSSVRGGGIFNDGGLSMPCTAVAGNTSGDGGGLYTAAQGHPSGCPTQGSFRRRLNKKALVRNARQETRFAAKVMQQQGEEVVPPEVILDGIGDFMGDAIFAGNSASGDGGGAYNEASSSFRDLTFDGNTALGRGGGLFQATAATHLNAERVTFSNNFAHEAGGGIFNASDNEIGFLYLRNSTVSGNFTNGFGGGIKDTGDDGLDLEHVTVTNNSAPQGNGGGIDADGQFSPASTIVARNMGGDCQAQLDSEGFNLDSDGTCFATGGSDIVNTDPQLGPLQNNGGQTETHLPESDSPVVDAAGSGSPCDAGGVAFTDDQRGFERPVGEACDIGSVELQENELPESPPGDFQTLIAGPGINVTTTDDAITTADEDCSLREAVITANSDSAVVEPACDPTDENFDLIYVPAGFYAFELTGAGEDLSATGDLDLTDDTTVVGDGVQQTIVDADQLDRVFDVNPAGIKDPAPSVTFEDLTIRNGSAEDGAGIRSLDDLTLTNARVAYNRGECLGGGIYSESPLILNGSDVVMNGLTGDECDADGGGGIYSEAPLTIESDSYVYMNNALFEGGGVFNNGPGEFGMSVIDSSVSGNVLTGGGESHVVVEGAGIYNETGAELEGSIVAGNVAFDGEGGGIYNGGDEGASSLDVFESVIALNVAGSSGGGIYADSSSLTTSEVTAYAGNISGGGGGVYNTGEFYSTDDIYLFNFATGGGSGGALWNAGQGFADLLGGGVLFNTATNASGSFGPGPARTRAQQINDFTGGGGGILNDSDGDPQEEPGEENSGLDVVETSIFGNVATSGNGGGVNNRGVAYVADSDLVGNVAAGEGSGSVGGGGAINCHVLYVEDSMIEDNVAADGGGGLFNQEICQINQTLHLDYSTVAGNVAVGSGGGAMNTFGTIDAFNSTVSNNLAAAGLGGGFADQSARTIHLDSVTVAYNSSGPETGGGVHSGSEGVDALNSIVGHNYGLDCNNELTSNGFNVDSDGTCFGGEDDVEHDGDLDLKLGPLAFNSPGTTPTHALLTGSPAIDQTPDGEACPSDDQRHVSRPQGSMCDIGAYEGQQSPPPGPGGDPGPGPTQPPADTDLAITKRASPEPVESGSSLTYTITVKNNGPGAATGVVVTDQLPTEVGFVSSASTQGTCSGETTVTCQIGNMTNGQEVVVTIVVTTGSEGTVTNTAVVSSQSNDPTSTNNSSSATSTIVSGGGGEPGETERSVTVNDGHASAAARVEVEKPRRKRRKLVLHGAVIAPNQEECSSRVPVEVHKKRKKGRKAGQWFTKGEGLTRANGTYRFVLKHKAGRYRAFAPEVLLDNEHVCKSAVSRKLRHRRHRQRR